MIYLNTLLFKNWTKFEKILYSISLLSIFLSGIVFKSEIISIASAAFGISCAIMQAKGKVASQFIGVILVALYSIVSFKNGFYGEILIYIFIMLPLFISGIVSWLKNKDHKTNMVKPYELTKKEWIILAIISIVLFIGLYFLLRHFNTKQLLISTLSMVTSLFATYLIARRNKYGFLFYMGNDIILFILWGLPVLSGNLMLMPMIINPIINFINDNYGWYNWKKNIKKRA